MLAYIKLFVFIANQANSVSTAGPYICNHSNLNHTFAMSSVFKQKLLCGCVCAQITSLRFYTVSTSASGTSPPVRAASRPWRTTCLCITTTFSLPTSRVGASHGYDQTHTHKVFDKHLSVMWAYPVSVLHLFC